jgi:hypothetical protein
MRRKVTPESLHEFMRELASAARSPGKVYLTGGATALLLGFRRQTIDIDIRLDPEPGGVFEAIAHLKNRLDLNVKLASPADFMPPPTNWRERSPLIASYPPVEFYHYDFTMQALAKIERAHEQDLQDVHSFLKRGLVTPAELRATFHEISPGLIRFPAIDPRQFNSKLEVFLGAYERE